MKKFISDILKIIKFVIIGETNKEPVKVKKYPTNQDLWYHWMNKRQNK